MIILDNKFLLTYTAFLKLLTFSNINFPSPGEHKQCHISFTKIVHLGLAKKESAYGLVSEVL